MLVALLLGLLIGIGCLMVPLRRCRRFAEVQEEQKQQFAQDRQRVIDFMHLMAEALGENLSLQELRQRIVHASILCTGALSACIFEQTAAGSMRGVAVEGLFPPQRPLPPSQPAMTRSKFLEHVLKSEEFPLGEGIIGRVAQSRRPALVADAGADPRTVRHEDPALVLRSLIAVPLLFRERFFGVLAVANPADERPFTEVEFSLLQSLGEQAALALHNAEFFNLQLEKSQLDLDLSIASGIQQMLLPRRTVSFAALDLDARYTPAQKVGGDLYDIIGLPDGRLGVVVADVSGKGIPASLLMAIVRTSLRHIAPRYSSPSRVLTELNRSIAADIQGGLYVTMLYAVIDVARNTISFARAGHELPLLVRRDLETNEYTARYVGSEGMPVGMVPDEMFAEVIADQIEPFVPGDVMVLYTDGVTEAPNEDRKEFSGARLADIARQLHSRTAREINDGIVEAVEAFVGDETQHDDLTLVSVKRI
ncbi:MAG TPA: GAF domain-containing SpoIIE family protein phosphatase [Opitutaceae bacterium]|jgi:sigma-B regulation protein RsbU (phosphoserine phosphatase)|nr:GAF domain-containing SpoIIE family protein phosphatase [Opitutaceae bacterium]